MKGANLDGFMRIVRWLAAQQDEAALHCLPETSGWSIMVGPDLGVNERGEYLQSDTLADLAEKLGLVRPQ